jgi:hypothetical protein
VHPAFHPFRCDYRLSLLIFWSAVAPVARLFEFSVATCRPHIWDICFRPSTDSADPIIATGYLAVCSESVVSIDLPGSVTVTSCTLSAVALAWTLMIHCR